MTLDDIIKFVSENEGLLIRTGGGRTSFRVRLTDRAAFGITPENGIEHSLSYQTVADAVALFNLEPSFELRRYHSTWNESYIVGIFQRLAEVSPLLILPADEMEILKAPVTEQIELRKSRRGQGQFRYELIKLRKKCYVTGLADQEFLRASHIKAWSDSNNHERLDPHNGLLLSPNWDLLFNDGYISFSDDGALLVSSKVPATIHTAWGIVPDFRGADLGPKTKSYLRHHRAFHFPNHFSD